MIGKMEPADVKASHFKGEAAHKIHGESGGICREEGKKANWVKT